MTVRYANPIDLTRGNITTAVRSTGTSTDKKGVALASSDKMVCKMDDDSRVAFMLSSYSTSAVPDITFRVTVQAGDDDRAYKKALGNGVFTFATTAAITPDGHIAKHAFLGPFESARFAVAATSASDGISPKGINTLILQPFLTRTSNITTASNDSTVNKLGSSDGGRLLVTPFRLPK